MTYRAIRDLLSFTRPYPWAVPVLVLLGVAASFAEGLGIGLIIPLLDSVLQQSADAAASGPFAGFVRGIADQFGSDRVVFILGGLIIALVALKTLIIAVHAFISTGVIARAMRDLRLALCRQLLEVDYEYLSLVPQGKLVNLLDAQTYRASEALRELTVLIGSLCTVLVFVGLLLLLSWQLTLVAAAVVIPASLAIRFLASWAQVLGEQLVKSYSDLAERILELLVAMRTIRIFNREQMEAERFDLAAQRVKRAYRRTEMLNAVIPALVEFLYVPAFVAVLAAAWFLQIGVPSVLVFMLLLYRLQTPLKRINASRVMLATYASGIRELQALTSREGKPYIKSGNIVFQGLNNSVEFDHVTFAYGSGETAAVKNVSFRLRAGMINAIVGGSGSGKSTLIHLLCRLHDPQSGVVRADGVDLRELDVKSWRSRIAFAGQDADLLSGSVRFNIAYGVDNASDEAVEEVARVAKAHDFICGLPGGYESEVGPRGTRLSGGQRQRIALARAMLRKPDILVLDEATNAVDGITEMAIHDAIERLAGQTTIVLVAHRLNTIKRTQHVIVMSSGRVVQEGEPCQLLASPGPLAELFDAHRSLELGTRSLNGEARTL